ncbi:MAG: YggS family pyridoxal phosphate-dependent enzyme [Rhodospirillaceae bacterium]|nr:YggS family pyridoxal phosphate-dependent enzyme [Rhodospirillaceae bacterium]
MLKISENIRAVKAKIATAAKDAERDPVSVSLLAVSKTIAEEKILEAIKAGQNKFGENRVQEVERKWPALREAGASVELHLIGALQTNKTRTAVALFDVIETLDRLKLAYALAREMDRLDRRIPCFIQVNTGEESQKSGVLPNEADSFIDQCLHELDLPVAGLMCIPPANEERSLHFALLRKIAARNGLPLLSMGMSADYECAIAFGATHVRVGRAIFGERIS